MKCQIEGCSNRGVAKNLCDKHRKRLARHGHTDKTRPDDWGERRKHPLYHTWRWIAVRTKEGIHPVWEDFWTFVKDVGERPKGHNIQKIDEKACYGPDNWFWKETTSSKDRAKYAREWRKRNPLASKNSDLKKQFGITINDYMEMLDNQDGVCGICGEKENGRFKYLAVDHCHKSNEIRGLLCHRCNKGLGNFKDDIGLLSKAIDWLN